MTECDYKRQADLRAHIKYKLPAITQTPSVPTFDRINFVRNLEPFDRVFDAQRENSSDSTNDSLSVDDTRSEDIRNMTSEEVDIASFLALLAANK